MAEDESSRLVLSSGPGLKIGLACLEIDRNRNMLNCDEPLSVHLAVVVRHANRYIHRLAVLHLTRDVLNAVTVS